MSEQELLKKDLKIQAQKETISALQEANADLRVDLTLLLHNYNDLKAEYDRLAEPTEIEEAADTE